MNKKIIYGLVIAAVILVILYFVLNSNQNKNVSLDFKFEKIASLNSSQELEKYVMDHGIKSNIKSQTWIDSDTFQIQAYIFRPCDENITGGSFDISNNMIGLGFEISSIPKEKDCYYNAYELTYIFKNIVKKEYGIAGFLQN